MDFNFKKKYGQNFLTNQEIINNIVDSIKPSDSDLIIEIGPGGGALTRKLKKYGANILCYEVDEDTKKYLNDLEDDKTRIIYDDFLKRDILNDISNIKYNDIFIIGNLPYYITTPIITKVIDSGIKIKEAVFMVQKEVADRFSAQPKSREYGSITVFLNYYFDIKKLFIVGKNNFVPKPNVDSSVIKLICKNRKLEVDIVKFEKLVKDSFQFKRKNLNNNLKSYDREKIGELLIQKGYSINNRAEDLPFDIFVYLANNL